MDTDTDTYTATVTLEGRSHAPVLEVHYFRLIEQLCAQAERQGRRLHHELTVTITVTGKPS